MAKENILLSHGISNRSYRWAKHEPDSGGKYQALESDEGAEGVLLFAVTEARKTIEKQEVEQTEKPRNLFPKTSGGNTWVERTTRVGGNSTTIW